MRPIPFTVLTLIPARITILPRKDARVLSPVRDPSVIPFHIGQDAPP